MAPLLRMQCPRWTGVKSGAWRERWEVRLATVTGGRVREERREEAAELSLLVREVGARPQAALKGLAAEPSIPPEIPPTPVSRRALEESEAQASSEWLATSCRVLASWLSRPARIFFRSAGDTQASSMNTWGGSM